MGNYKKKKKERLRVSSNLLVSEDNVGSIL